MPAPAALEQAFLEDIVAHPDDPSLWLILADLLEEHEDPRAELVRLTWSLTHDREHPDFASRQTRVQALIAGGMVPVVPRLTLPPNFEFTWVPPGTFLMGSPEEEPAHHIEYETQHRVTLTSGYWFGVYPVTQGQWQEVRGTNPSYFARGGSGSSQVHRISDRKLARFPVENVTWDEARSYCTSLGERFGRTFRLPTEAEWEHACRAGMTTPFHFGTVFDGSQANADGKYPYGTPIQGPFLNRPTTVGSYPPNARGIHDLHGNVREWTLDAFRPDYEILSEINPLYEVENPEARVLRGGSWFQYPSVCRTAYRYPYRPSGHTNTYGFRLVLVP